MQPIAPSELIITPKNQIYHLGLRPEDLADIIIVVGDQARVTQITKHFDKITFQQQNREFITHTGFIGNKHLSVISSGIGIDNVEILMTELDALANINFESRVPNETHKSLKIIRLGTSGSMRAEIGIDTFLASYYSIGIDNLMTFYALPQSPEEQALCQALQKHIPLALKPYAVRADKYLWNTLVQDLPQGNALTAPGFYAPQGRELRLPLQPNYLQNILSFQFQGFQFTNFEMESSAYYAFGQLLGHQMLSINAIVANRALKQFSSNPNACVEKLIQHMLPKIVAL